RAAGAPDLPTLSVDRVVDVPDGRVVYGSMRTTTVGRRRGVSLRRRRAWCARRSRPRRGARAPPVQISEMRSFRFSVRPDAYGQPAANWDWKQMKSLTLRTGTVVD